MIKSLYSVVFTILWNKPWIRGSFVGYFSSIFMSKPNACKFNCGLASELSAEKPLSCVSLIKEQAAARFNDLVGATDVVTGELLALLPFFQAKPILGETKHDLVVDYAKVKGYITKKVK